MTIGIIIGHQEGTLEDRFARAAGQGFHHYQLLSWDPALWTDREAEKIKHAVKAARCPDHSFLVRLDRPQGMELH